MTSKQTADQEIVLQIVASRLPGLLLEEIETLVIKAQYYFLEQTGRYRIPKRATYLWADLAIAMQVDQLEAHQAGAAQQSGGVISSIKRGDTTIQYAEGQVSIAGRRLVSSMEDRLSKYRVVKTR